MASAEARVAAAAVLSRAAFVLLAVLSDYLVADYDTSSDLVYSGPGSSLVRWDAVHMLAIARGGGYSFEQQYAFFPLLPMASRALGALFGDSVTASVLAGIVFSNACFVAAAVALVKLGRRELRDEQLAFVAGILFCLTPGGVFLTSLYTEAPMALFVFAGLLARSHQRPFLAAILFGLGSLTRGNGIFFAGFFAYDLLQSAKRVSWVRWLAWEAPKAAIFCVISAAGFVALQAAAFAAFCSTDDADLRRPWCDEPIPFIYQFVQREYWNVGFLNYFELKQVPNFAIAAPILLSCTAAIVRYFAYDWRRAVSLGLSGSARARQTKETHVPIEYHDGLLPHMFLLLYTVLLTVFVAHIQIANRMFSCMPVMYWALADGIRHGRRGAKAVVSFFVIYAAAVCVLFANFYPPA